MYDLKAHADRLDALTVKGRMSQLTKMLPPVGLVALNGIPFQGDPVTYLGHPVSIGQLQTHVRLALGFGGVLTYLNPDKLDLDTLADLSLSQGHDWALLQVNATLCFSGCPTFVEMSFARDGGFHLSWVEPRGKTDWNLSRVFTATASLKKWKKYLSNRNSKDFLNTQREWLDLAYDELWVLYPPYLFEP